MKKQYNNPQTEAMPLLVATMLCASDPGSSTIAPTLQFHPEGADDQW